MRDTHFGLAAAVRRFCPEVAVAQPEVADDRRLGPQAAARGASHAVERYVVLLGERRAGQDQPIAEQGRRVVEVESVQPWHSLHMIEKVAHAAFLLTSARAAARA